MIDSNPAAGLSEAKRALLQQRMRGRPTRAEVRQPLSRHPGAGPARLSVVQEQLWYFAQLAPENPVYNEAASIHKDGDFDHGAFRDAFNEIVRRHEIWRSTFATVDGEPVQVVHPATALDLPLLDLSTLPRLEAEERATTLAAEQARRPYDLERGPLIRPLLVRVAPDHHRLHLALHHLVFDAVSLYRVVLPELSSLYEDFVAGRAPSLPPPLVQYSDYATWSRAQVGSVDFSRRIAHWRERLDGVPTVELPLDRPRPAQQAFRGGIAPLTIDRKLADGLRVLSRETNSTLFQTLAAAFAVLLQRYSGQPDVVFGTLADLRERPELEGMVGYCLSPLVVRADAGDDPSFTELLRRVRTDVLDGLRNIVPFQELVRELQPPRDGSSNPFFQAAIVLEPATGWRKPGWSLHLIGPELSSAVGSAKFDLHLELDERPEGHIEGRLLFNSDLFDLQTGQRMAGHWETLLAGIADDPGRPVSALPLLTRGEREQLTLWNATEADYPREACVHHLIADQARRTPDAVAAVFGEETLTYAQLQQRATSIARRVIESNPHGGVVAIHVERSLDMLAGMLGTWYAGAAYLPLDPQFPAERLAYMLEDSGATTLLTQRRVRSQLTGHGATVIHLDDDDSGDGCHEPPQLRGRADDCAYLLYTSGSTGKPKGVPVRHGAIVNLLTSMSVTPGMRSSDTLVAVTTPAFDIAAVELWLPLITGAKTVIAPAEVVADGWQLAQLISDAGASVVQMTPSHWQLLIDSGWKGQPGLVVLCGGEAVSPQLAEALLDRAEAVWNMYGPTETTVWSTTARLRRGRPVTIGRPIANTRVYVLDRCRGPVPIGVGGELWIGGDGVSGGYLHRPELTAERFVDDPFVPGGRMYQTGDLVRWRADGELQYLGRLDHQVKVRGFRIELGEIETALLAHPSVAHAVVVARERAMGDIRLAAYVVPRGSAPSSAELGELLRRTIPEYMVPSAFVTLESMPLTPNGKVDRKALPEPEWTSGARATWSGPRSTMEARVAEIWGKRLGTRNIGVDDNFFELGGHSLLATRVLMDVARELGVQVPLREMFEQGLTVAGMAALVEAATPPDGLSPTARTRAVTRRQGAGPARLSAGQAQLWYFTQLAPDNPVYNLAFTIRKQGECNVDALRAAFNEVVQRHEILRTTFEVVDGEPSQVVQPPSRWELPVVDLSHLPADAAEAEAGRLAEEQATRPYDVGRGPLLRARLSRLGEHRHRLDLAMHHVIFDVGSLRILVAELVAAYELVRGRRRLTPDRARCAVRGLRGVGERLDRRRGLHGEDRLLANAAHRRAAASAHRRSPAFVRAAVPRRRRAVPRDLGYGRWAAECQPRARRLDVPGGRVGLRRADAPLLRPGRLRVRDHRRRAPASRAAGDARLLRDAVRGAQRPQRRPELQRRAHADARSGPRRHDQPGPIRAARP